MSHDTTPTPIPLDRITLARGSHGPIYRGACCLVECANLIAARVVVAPVACELTPAPFADDHPSISRVLRAYAIRLNDDWDDTARQRLLPYAPRLLCTNTGAADEEARAWLATDWLVRTYTPAWLRLAGLDAQARALASLARITDATLATAAQPTLDAARRDAAAARAAAREAVWEAARAAAGEGAWEGAWEAAREAAWTAARDAAWEAAREAAWNAAGAGAWEAAREAAREAAGAAARQGAWVAAWAAAWEAAREAAREAAWGAAGEDAWEAALAAADRALAPTVAALRDSALDLFDEMLAVGR